MFREHDDLFLTRFKKRKELCCMMQVFPGFAAICDETFNGGLLKTETNESQTARKNNNERHQKNNPWSASKIEPQPLESFVVGCKDGKRYSPPSSIKGPTSKAMLFTRSRDLMRPRRKEAIWLIDWDVRLENRDLTCNT